MRAKEQSVVLMSGTCPLHTPRGAWRRLLRFLVALLLPWAEIIRLRRAARKALDAAVELRDDALVARSALKQSWLSLVELFDESGAELRGTMSIDDSTGEEIGRRNPPEWFDGWDKHAQRVHAKVGLMLKRLSHLRQRSESISTVIGELDVGRPDVISSVR
jgi:hypothetical protein